MLISLYVCQDLEVPKEDRRCGSPVTLYMDGPHTDLVVTTELSVFWSEIKMPEEPVHMQILWNSKVVDSRCLSKLFRA